MGDAPATSVPLKPFAEPVYTSRLTGNTSKRIALVRLSTSESMDHGWTHWILDTYKIPYTIINERDLAGDSLRGRFDAIVFPEGGVPNRRGGRAGGAAGGGAAGGRGGAGAGGAAAAPAADPFQALDAFVNAGGTVLAFNSACTAVIAGMQLPVRKVSRV